MESREGQQVSLPGRFTGCQMAAVIVTILVATGACVLWSFLVGGLVGYSLGRSLPRSAAPPIQMTPPYQLPIPYTPPSPGEVDERPCLGIFYSLLEEGAQVKEVRPGSPAEEAGLRPGDVILEVDGEPVGRERGRPLLFYIFSRHPGEEVRLTVERDGEIREVEVTLARWSVCFP